MPIEGHGGELIAAALRARGVDSAFTLIGGHIFAVLDGAQRQGIRVVDVRHEQAAGFAAEAHGKLARAPGVAAVDAGPGVLNAVNVLASARTNGSPMVLIAGKPPQSLIGKGALNETSQTEVISPLAKRTITLDDIGTVFERAAGAYDAAAARHRGPVYVEAPLDTLMARATASAIAPGAAPATVHGDLEGAAALLSAADRPLLFLGSDVWLDGAEATARALAEKQRIPVVMNGMARGILPSDHALAFSAARGAAFKRADVILIVGVPLDFRLGYGWNFGEAKVVHLQDDVSGIASHIGLAASASGPIAELLDGLALATPRERDGWLDELRGVESQRRGGYRDELSSAVAPIHPARVYGELVPRLPRDAIVIADGGDFASYAGKYVEVFEPGGWLDPGPYGCLGTSAGYALGAGSLYPNRKIVVLLGDGAAGFSLADWDSLVRHSIDVTFVCGNNGAWGLEKQPMRGLYGREVAADLRPGTRYDEVMRAFGGHGELVREPAELGDAIARALATEGPSLVNVITDPEIAYPRGSG
ncbi:MAG: acetolactate synthase [Actinomycetota bacterium]